MNTRQIRGYAAAALVLILGTLALWKPAEAVSFGPPGTVKVSLAPIAASLAPVPASLAPLALTSSAPYSVLASLAPVPASLAPLTLASAAPYGVTLAQVPAAAALADGTTNPTTTLVGDLAEWWNGSAWDRARSASLINEATTTATGAAMVAPPGNWSIVSYPAVNTQATATKALVPSTSHVLTSVQGSVISNALLGAAASVLLVVRDGASGSGAIIWEAIMSLPVTAGDADHVTASGLNIVGTSGNALTVEFTANGGASTFESVSATGYDVK